MDMLCLELCLPPRRAPASDAPPAQRANRDVNVAVFFE